MAKAHPRMRSQNTTARQLDASRLLRWLLLRALIDRDALSDPLGQIDIVDTAVQRGGRARSGRFDSARPPHAMGAVVHAVRFRGCSWRILYHEITDERANTVPIGASTRVRAAFGLR